MAQYKETAVIIEKEIEKLSSLEKFERFISLSIYYHVNRCENDEIVWYMCENNTNCIFVNKYCHIYHRNYTGGENEALNLQKICRNCLGNLFSLGVFSKSLASLEREQERLELKFKELLKIWNTNI